MFLDRLLRHNPALAAAAVRGHQHGDVLANTYLIDLDALAANAAALRAEAGRLGLGVYFMSKQFGRNPDACRAALAGGLESAVAVELAGMEALVRHQIPVGHVGHLVQPHRGSEDAVVAAAPEVVTVFSLETGERLAAAARRRGVEQPVLMRVRAEGDRFYFGHGGGFALEDIVAHAGALERLGNLRVEGATSFPCLLSDATRRKVVATPNLATVVEAVRQLCHAGFSARQVNAPGTTSVGVMRILAEAGATHVEPGNALHGTTPQQLFDDGSPEVPAIVFVSEVSHLDGEDGYVLAAGYYADKVLGDYQLEALAGRDESALEQRLRLDVIPDGAISYYAILRGAASAGIRPGDTVVACFRPQSFVTRARSQSVGGVGGGGELSFGSRYDQEAREVSGVS